ncbi:MAG TPA: deoxynucleoside kinase [Bacteroidia bacterium]|nr:deoxynucleoside kinase [Bacteroidia bacterium]
MYICIEGNIGAGKTTLAIALAKKLKADFLPEHYEDNPLLPLFYKDKKKMAFPLEYSFLIDRHAQLHNYFKKRKSKITVADFSLYKCLWFAKTNLSKKEYALYKKHFKTIEEVAQKPDLIVYIHTHHTNLLSNIKKRGRNFETSIDKKYLQAVTKSYLSGLKKIDIPVLEVQVSSYTSNTNSSIIKQLETNLSSKLKSGYQTIKV